MIGLVFRVSIRVRLGLRLVLVMGFFNGEPVHGCNYRTLLCLSHLHSYLYSIQCISLQCMLCNALYYRP